MFHKMKTGWNWIRIVYLVIGIWVIAQSALEGEWIGIVLGIWPTLMGLFGLACAGGNCSSGTCDMPANKHTDH